MRARERSRNATTACLLVFAGLTVTTERGLAQQLEIRQPDRRPVVEPSGSGAGRDGAGQGANHGGSHRGDSGHHHHGHHHHSYWPGGYRWYGYGLNPPVYAGWPYDGIYPSLGSGYPFTSVYGSPWLYVRPGYGWGSYGNDGISVVPPVAWQQPGPWRAAPVPGGLMPDLRVPDAAVPPPQVAVAGVVLPRAVDVVVDGHPEVAEIHRRVDALKSSTPLGRDRADRLIAQGDQYFADQRFGAAAAKYRDAVAKAPDYPEAHFRLAHCYLAIARFNLAVTRFLMALELAGSAERVNFSLAELYRGDKLAKQHHLEQLEDAIAREPEDGGLVFLKAISLHYDQQPLEAREGFARAREMPGAHQRYLHHFLPAVPIAEAE